MSGPRLWVVVAAGFAGLAWGLWLRGYHPSLALILGLAVGAVTYVAFRTWDRVRELHRPERPEDRGDPHDV